MRAIARDLAERHPSAEAFHFELRTLMNMQGMRIRVPTATGSLPSGLLNSPIAFAMFERTGAIRFANQTFLELCDGSAHSAVQTWTNLRICHDSPKIAGALDRTLVKQAPVYRKLHLGAAEAPTLLVLAPEIRAGRVVGVHATLIAWPERAS
jgi:hypothetical protein